MAILVPLDRIDDSPFQTRLTYDEERIREIAASIERDGLIQPPPGRFFDEESGQAVMLSTGGLQNQREVLMLLEEYPHWRVQLAVGHNRLRAMRSLGREAMPVELRSLSDEQMDLLAWAENHQRADLTPVEEACAIRDRIRRHGWTQEQAGEALGLGRSTVANKLRLLELPEPVQEALAKDSMSERAAAALLPVCAQPEPLDRGLRGLRDYRGELVYEQLVERAASGELRSDQIRREAERLLGQATHELSIVDPAEDFGDLAGVRASTCSACALLVKVKDFRGKPEPRCGDAACLQVKHQHVAERILAAAADLAGLPVTAERDRDRTSTFADYGSGQKLARQLLKKGCPQARLHIRIVAGGYHGATVPGHEKAELVCVHAKGGRCTCQAPEKEKAAAAVETRTGRAKAKLIGEERYVEPARAAVREALLSCDARVWDVALYVIRCGSNTDGRYQKLHGFCRDDGQSSDAQLTFEAPLRGMGIGQQIAWLTRQIAERLHFSRT